MLLWAERRGAPVGEPQWATSTYTSRLQKVFCLLGFDFTHSYFPKVPLRLTAGLGMNEDAMFVLSISLEKAVNATYTGAHSSSHNEPRAAVSR